MKTNIREAHANASAPQPQRWSKERIRAARLIAISPLLEQRGMHIIESGGGNYIVRELPGLIIKDSYWRWPEHGISGNTIDLCMRVLRLSFNNAMLALSQACDGAETNGVPKAS